WVLSANTLVHRFVPTEATGNDMWVRETDELHTARWYPTVTTLSTDADDKDILLVLGGFGAAAGNTYEAFDPTLAPGSGAWQQVPGTSDYIFPGPSTT